MQSLSKHESRQHGTLAFPAEYYYIDPGYPRYNMAVHWHKEWELIHIIEGSFHIHAGDEQYSAQSGDVLLIRDGMLHGGTPDRCTYECFVFDLHSLFRNLDAVKKYLRPIYRHQVLPRIYYCSNSDSIITAAVSELMEACRRQTSSSPFGDFHELATFGCLSRLFTLILEKGYYDFNPEEASVSSQRINQLKTTLEYIEDHYASPISLAQLARRAGMNPKYFCRFFHSITHQTPMDYVNDYRIEQAAQMLLTTDQSVTEIGMECGFNDSSYFVKVFRKYRGVTPNQYRRANR